MFVAGSVGGSACAMQQSKALPPPCAVSGSDRLPAEVGGGEAICSAIRAALREQSSGTGYAVRVTVESASSLSARVTLSDGRTLPRQRMAVSDRQLNPASIKRFAAAVANAVAGSGP